MSIRHPDDFFVTVRENDEGDTYYYVYRGRPEDLPYIACRRVTSDRQTALNELGRLQAAPPPLGFQMGTVIARTDGEH